MPSTSRGRRAASTGEWTPGYLIDFWTPGLLARAAPEARILILLRDPVERFRSSLSHQLAHLAHALIDRDIQGAFQRGLYAPQLRRVLDAFPAEQVFIGQYEACRADPARELARTFAFLGLAPFEPDAAAYRGEVNPTTGPRFEPSPACAQPSSTPTRPTSSSSRASCPALTCRCWPTAREVGLA